MKKYTLSGLGLKSVNVIQHFYSFTFIVSIFAFSFSNVVSGQTCTPTSSISGGNTTLIFSTVGTCNWTVPLGVTSITVETWGGGGGGGAARVTCNCQQTSAGGGGKGGMYSSTPLTVTPSAVYQVTVGNGGAAGNSSAGGAGGKSALTLSGTDVAWSSGGNGGGYSVSANNQAGGTTYAVPGTGSGPTIFNGGNGAPGRKTTTRQAGGGGGGGGGTSADGVAATNPANGAGGPANTTSPGGAGGTLLGGNGGAGANATTANASTPGTAGADRGGGGGGGRAYANTTNQSTTGGAGGRGEVRITFGTPPAGLPVTLSSFNANCEGNKTAITWATASEKNSDYFTLERSRDGKNWTVVKTVTAAGTSNSMNYYDVNEDVVAEMYYRLTQTDFDGNKIIYDPIHIDCGSANNDKLIVYPNPNDGAFTIAVNTTEIVGEATIFIHDLSGKVITFRDVNVLSGTNTILFENTNMERGTYIVSIQGKNKTSFTPVKLIIQ